MALIAAQTPTIAGITPTYAAATGGGDTITPDERGFLHFKNTNAATRTVTIVDPRTVNETGQLYPDVAVVIPATTGDKMIGPMHGAYANPTTGVINLTYDAATNLTVAYITVD